MQFTKYSQYLLVEHEIVIVDILFYYETKKIIFLNLCIFYDSMSFTM